MPTFTIDEAQARLPELIDQLGSGGEVVITRGDAAVAKLVAAPAAPPPRVPQLGTLRGTVLSMDRFDDPIDGFEDCQP